jgi:hypothetical protein
VALRETGTNNGETKNSNDLSKMTLSSLLFFRGGQNTCGLICGTFLKYHLPDSNPDSEDLNQTFKGYDSKSLLMPSSEETMLPKISKYLEV